MKVLWFEVTVPQNYVGVGSVVGGWQDALEHIVKDCNEIELSIAFTTNKYFETKVVNGVTYEPINMKYSFIEKQKSNFSWKIDEKKILDSAEKIINKINPDIIHIFGNEWPFGLIASKVNIPVVIHIQGSIIPYNNALYPPKYSKDILYKSFGLNVKKRLQFWRSSLKDESRLEMEKRIWKCVKNYMGRTNWDYALSRTLNPDSRYFHVEEALRPIFLSTDQSWQCKNDSKLVLFSTGCTSFWKGPDMMIKTAKILKELHIDFEWIVAGNMQEDVKISVEKQEKTTFVENNIKIIGFVKPEKIIDYLCNSSMYVHTAYIENSPNSICEAQYLGVPIVSTNVGGISSLLQDGENATLVPANDPWQMAFSILNMWKNEELKLRYSQKGKECARKRHNPEHILAQLLNCYKSII